LLDVLLQRFRAFLKFFFEVLLIEFLSCLLQFNYVIHHWVALAKKVARASHHEISTEIVHNASVPVLFLLFALVYSLFQLATTVF
jgi:hypothetical protein